MNPSQITSDFSNNRELPSRLNVSLLYKFSNIFIGIYYSYHDKFPYNILYILFDIILIVLSKINHTNNYYYKTKIILILICYKPSENCNSSTLAYNI